MTCRPAVWLLALLLIPAPVVAAGAIEEIFPGVSHDPAVPAPVEVLGHDLGEEITSVEGIGAYLAALQRAAPERARLVEYARSWEGRPLHLLVIGSAERIAALDEVRAGLARLGDPRVGSAADAEALIAKLPVVSWLLAAVHGNEISSPEAALAVAYHLLAARGDAEVDRVLAESLVVIDPLQNPDGRARFLVQTLLGRAARPDPEPAAIEHDEPWPGGRSNHYLFDMNRDWFALTQPETRGRIAVALAWLPQVAVDLHEMGGDQTYYFAPPAAPANPSISEAQHRWFERFGRANAERFDAHGWPWFAREIFDSFYPGYGESWPLFQGAVGMTYEQASARGLAWRREDGSTLTFRQGVVQHATAAFTTLATAAANREALLRDFRAFRVAAVDQGRRGPAREYALLPGVDPSRAERLARLLAAQGIEVRRAEAAFRLGARELPAGTFLVDAAQPAGQLVRNLLEPHTPMEPAFVDEQDRRRRERRPGEIYDVTAWSLPDLYDVELAVSSVPLDVRASAVAAAAAPEKAALPTARVGYLVPWGSAAAAAVAEALGEGLEARVAGEPFTLAGRRFEIGATLFRAADNGPALVEKLGGVLARHGVEAVPVDSAWVDDGISLGSDRMRPLAAPRVLLAWDRPASSQSAGWTRWLLERRYGLAVTAVRTSSLGRVELDRYDALVLPSGDYSRVFAVEEVRRLREWIERGGTLVTIAEASRWATERGAGLLATTTELKGGAPERKPEKDGPPEKAAALERGAQAPYDYDRAIQPEEELPDETSGAVLRVVLDPEHWLSAGTDGEVQAVVDGSRVFTPIRLDAGRNAGTWAAADRLVAGGLVWPESKAQLARKAFLIDQPIGKGHLIAFAEDPAFRGYAEATGLLLANAVILGRAF